MSLRPSGILGLVTDGGHGPPEAVAVAPIRVEDRAGLVSGRARQLIEVRQERIPGGGATALRLGSRSMTSAEGFAYVVRDDVVAISHHGRPATKLLGRRAQAFIEDVASGDPQELMARLTGNYRRGNEQQARNHPRNHLQEASGHRRRGGRAGRSPTTAYRQDHAACGLNRSAVPPGGGASGRTARQYRMFSAEVSPVAADETHFKTALLSRKDGPIWISIAQ